MPNFIIPLLNRKQLCALKNQAKAAMTNFLHTRRYKAIRTSGFDANTQNLMIHG